MKALTVDIGNSLTSFGFFDSGKLEKKFSLPTQGKSNLFYKRSILNNLNSAQRADGCIDKIIICSVVPRRTKVIKSVLATIFKPKISIVGINLKVPIKNKYRFPDQVGQDRLVGAYAGLVKYGPGLIIVDFGTAVTFDVVSLKGEYLGGLIFPGLELSLEALNLQAALLPKIKIKQPNSLLGKDTVSSINNVLVLGMAGVCDSLIGKLQKKFKGYRVIATGGNVQFIKRFSRRIKTIHSYLVLDGLYRLAS